MLYTICFYNFGLQPETNMPPFDDMYTCEVCNWTCYWVRLKSTGCLIERQRKLTRVTTGIALAVLTKG